PQHSIAANTADAIRSTRCWTTIPNGGPAPRAARPTLHASGNIGSGLPALLDLWSFRFGFFFVNWTDCNSAARPALQDRFVTAHRNQRVSDSISFMGTWKISVWAFFCETAITSLPSCSMACGYWNVVALAE